MRSRYDSAEAERLVAELMATCSEDLARRVHTSRLLGGDPALVLHGGGNTSVKTVVRGVTGGSVEVLCVKGSGGDLGRIGPTGFATCRLAPLRQLCALDALTDDEMVKALRSQMLDPTGPAPSVEALLHAFLPGKFVDHTHADAVVTLVDQPDAARIATEVWGPGFAFVPYVMPGFALARRVVALGADRPGLQGLILEKHGIFTWGATAEESYERMIAAVTAAERWRDAHRRPQATSALAAPAAPPRPTTAAERILDQRRLAPAIRGAVGRRSRSSWVATWRDDEAILAFLQRPDARALTERGTVTPDHVIRVRPRPLWLADPSADGSTLRDLLDGALEQHAAAYHAYFDRNAPRHPAALRRLDPFPRVVLVPGVGALTLGRTVTEAQVAGDIVARALTVMADAEDVGRYEPVAESDLFDVEYWSLEQAKLAATGAAGPFAGRIAFVTGGARGIGLATAEEFLRLGAHVMLTDRDGDALAIAAASLRERFASRVASETCDVTSESSVQRAIAATVTTFGGLDVVISNAGSAPSGLLHTAEGDAALARSLEVNLLGHQRVARLAVGVMLGQHAGGCLLFNASKSAVSPGREFGPYAIAKAGVLALMRQYAVDYGAEGIRSNAVNADRIRTDLFGDGVLEARAKARGVSPESYFRENLLGRETLAGDVARAFAYLAGADATTGGIVSVDGGNAGAFVR